MKLGLAAGALVLVLFGAIYPGEIYPSRVKKRIKAQYEEINISAFEGQIFRVRAGAYFAYIFDLLLTGALFMLSLFILIVPATDRTMPSIIFAVLGLVFFGALTAFLLAHLLYFFPRRRMVYRNGTVYYRNGSKERAIDRIAYIGYNRNPKSNYFTLNVRIPGEKKPLSFDFLSFAKPEVVYKIMLSKISGDAKREEVLKRVTRR